jgi:anaerobic selenocysteine-containing dehydrogenase
MWVEMCAEDAGALGLVDGDRVRIESPRGEIAAPLRIAGVRPGTVFVPFRYGYWDLDRARTARARRRRRCAGCARG